MKFIHAAIWFLAVLMSLPCPAAPNLILISVDTLRQDHVGIYGYPRKTTPNIDRLLLSGARFTDAYCNIPLTNPSFSSLMTSRYAHETGSTRNGVPTVGNLETVAEILKRNGYSSVAFLSNWPLKSHISGLSKGFDIYEDNFFKKRWIFFNNERDAREVTELASAWLDEKPKEPFFLWAHYSDPHQPYLLHRGFTFASGPGQPSETQDKIDAYDSEVAYADHYVGVLLDKIRSLGLDKNSLIIFTADHGEELGEHGYTGHGRHVYDESMRVPFGMSGPGMPAGLKVDSQIELLDVAPTMLAFAGLPAGRDMRGRNLLPYISGAKSWPEHFMVYYETFPGAVRGEGAEKIVNVKDPTWIGLKLDNLKVTYHLSGSRWEMFNLKSDPGERKDLSDPSNPVFVRYSDHLLAWYHGWENSMVLGRTDAMTEEDKKRLEALGYLK